MTSTLDDLEGLLRTLLCQSCNIVAKRYVVGVAMVALNRTMTSFCNRLYQYSNYLCLKLQQFGRNFECKVSACSHHPCAPITVRWC